MSKQLLLALGAGGAAAAAVVASAATLGSVNSTDLGAGTSVVASCDTDGIDVDYTTAYDSVSASYKVATVVLDGVDAACDAQAIKITFATGTGTSLAEITDTVDDTSLSFPVTGVTAQALGGIAVVISGDQSA